MWQLLYDKNDFFSCQVRIVNNEKVYGGTLIIQNANEKNDIDYYVITSKFIEETENPDESQYLKGLQLKRFIQFEEIHYTYNE